MSSVSLTSFATASSILSISLSVSPAPASIVHVVRFSTVDLTLMVALVSMTSRPEAGLLRASWRLEVIDLRTTYHHDRQKDRQTEIATPWAPDVAKGVDEHSLVPKVRIRTEAVRLLTYLYIVHCSWAWTFPGCPPFPSLPIITRCPRTLSALHRGWGSGTMIKMDYLAWVSRSQLNLQSFFKVLLVIISNIKGVCLQRFNFWLVSSWVHSKK